MELGKGSLQEEALKRKERLKALRNKQLQNRDPEDGEPESKRSLEEIEEVKHRELKLRNYTPEDEELRERQDLANLAPRKPDWDLKRDVAKKLEKLEKRTQRAIAELIRDRLKGSEDDLAAAVGAVRGDEGDSD
ncbi:UNVERIFIED_CONTAM: hypothetical protein FKN15_041019 [Acipenser sinensis]